MMLIKVKVLPNSKKQEVIKVSDDSFRIRVKAKPERGEANREVCQILSSYFKIPKERIRLIKGFRTPNKIFEIKRKIQKPGLRFSAN